MAISQKDIYRGHRRFRTAVIVCVTIVAALIVAAVILFYSLQKFIVVTPDGVRLILPYMQNQYDMDNGPGGIGGDSENSSGESRPYETLPDDILVYDPPDYTNTNLGAGEDLSPVHGVVVPAKDISPAKLAELGDTAKANGENALVLELKPDSGQLAWRSVSPLAYAFGTSGGLEITETINKLKEKDIYLIAKISVCADSLMAARNSPLALKAADGKPYKYGDRTWLDVYNRDLRAYIFSVTDELRDMGFDEILLCNLSYPASLSAPGASAGGGVSSPADNGKTAALSPENAVNSFAKAIKERYSRDAIKISLLLDMEQLKAPEAVFIGQNPAILPKFFDRLWFETSPAESDADKILAGAGMSAAEAGVRLAAITDGKF